MTLFCMRGIDFFVLIIGCEQKISGVCKIYIQNVTIKIKHVWNIEETLIRI